MPLTYRTAAKRILEEGGCLVRHGSMHDRFKVNGVYVDVPRHPGDLSSKVEMDVKRALSRKLDRSL